MKFKWVCVVVVCCLLPRIVSAQMVTGRFGTSLYTWKQFDTVGVSHAVARGYETALLNISQGDVAFHASGFGTMNLNNSFGDIADVRVSNLYLRWKNIAHLADLSVGRVPVFAGVGNGIVDGGMLKLHTNDNMTVVTAYGGVNVHESLISTGSDDIKHNLFFGGQIYSNLFRSFRLGLSYMNRSISRAAYLAVRPDSAFNPAPVLISPDSKAQQLLGADFRYGWWDDAMLYGRYDYDLYNKRSIRAELSARVPLTAALAVTGDFIRREPLLYYNTIFTIFPMSSIKEYEGGLEYTIAPAVWVYGKAAYVQYTDALARRLTIGFNTPYIGARLSGDNGYAGQLSAASVSAQYPLADRTIIPAVEFSFARYRLDEYASDLQNVTSASGGGTFQPFPDISINAQVQYINNPVYSHDVRFLGKINYWFSRGFHLLGGGGEAAQ